MWALAALASISVSTDAAAQDRIWNRYSLEDLGGVFVRAEADDPCESVGVTRRDVQVNAEELLAESEVELLTEGEMLRNPALPELRITLLCVLGEEGASGSVAYSVSLRVQQAAQMTRDTQISLPEAVTWWSTAVGVAEAGAVEDALDEDLRTKIEEFATAYLEANAEEEESGAN
ncbi:MAG TPA: hypothetical protein EYQ64_07015 [Gemmatimonadetes bacterium]|nr:hypothetical protein [Gemmatimonadota bacterium]